MVTIELFGFDFDIVNIIYYVFLASMGVGALILHLKKRKNTGNLKK